MVEHHPSSPARLLVRPEPSLRLGGSQVKAWDTGTWHKGESVDFPVHSQRTHPGLSVLICKTGRIRLSFSLQTSCKGHEITLGKGLRAQQGDTQIGN